MKAALALAAALLAGCVTRAQLAPVQIVTPADSYRLHVEDARQYNICRCAALKDTTEACPAPTE